MLFQHPHQAGTDPKRPAFEEGLEGLSASILEEVQPESNAVYLDQGAGTLPAHHRSNQGVPSSPSKEAEAAENLSTYYNELTVRCTRCLVLCYFVCHRVPL